MIHALLIAAALAQPGPSERPLPPGTRAAENARIEPGLGLPDRIVHTGSGIVLILIRPGEFIMGEPGQATGRERRHRRIIREPFYLGETEVTVGEFRAFIEATGYTTDAERGIPEEDDKTIGAFSQTPKLHERHYDARASWRSPFPLLPAHTVREDHPVAQVSWNDAAAFCAHFGLELPSEARWEYARRAGREDPCPWVTDPAAKVEGNVGDASTARVLSTAPGEVFAFDDGEPTLGPVRAMAPNPWGLYEMAGNVEEWTSTPWAVPEPKDGDDETSPPPERDDGVMTLRGAVWFGGPGGCDAAGRFTMRPFSRRDFIGFRVCLPAPPR